MKAAEGPSNEPRVLTRYWPTPSFTLIPWAMASAFRLVGHVEDVEDCFFADFQPALHDPFGDLGVANRTGHYRFRGVVALLLRQDVVVRFDTKDDLFFFVFCHVVLF